MKYKCQEIRAIFFILMSPVVVFNLFPNEAFYALKKRTMAHNTSNSVNCINIHNGVSMENKTRTH